MVSHESSMLNFLVDQYKKELSDEDLIGIKVKRGKTLGCMNRNQIRDNINPWLEGKKLPTRTFTETELKKRKPPIVEKLGYKDLVFIDKEVSGRTGYLICLNDENPFIKKEILKSI